MSADAQVTLPDAHTAVVFLRLNEIAEKYVARFTGMEEATRAGLKNHAPLPSYEQFAECVRTVFLASLLEEEGRHIPLGVAFVPPNPVSDHFWLQAAEFRETLPFTPENLAKVAAAIDADNAQVAVFAPGNELRIWGLLRGINPFPHSGDEESAGAARGGESRLEGPSHLVCRAPRPGVLSIQYLGEPACAYSHGQVRPVGAADELARVLTEHWPMPFNQQNTLLTDCVRDIVSAVLRHRRGGTLLVVNDRSSIASHFEHWHEFVQAVPVMRELSEPGERRRAISFIAALTQADGVVVLDPLLQPRGFRAMIKSLGALTVGGARHRSASSVIESCEPGSALAIVCSHENQVTVLWRSGEGLGSWRTDGSSIVPPEW